MVQNNAVSNRLYYPKGMGFLRKTPLKANSGRMKSLRKLRCLGATSQGKVTLVSDVHTDVPPVKYVYEIIKEHIQSKKPCTFLYEARQPYSAEFFKELCQDIKKDSLFLHPFALSFLLNMFLPDQMKAKLYNCVAFDKPEDVPKNISFMENFTKISINPLFYMMIYARYWEEKKLFELVENNNDLCKALPLEPDFMQESDKLAAALYKRCAHTTELEEIFRILKIKDKPDEKKIFNISCFIRDYKIMSYIRKLQNEGQDIVAFTGRWHANRVLCDRGIELKQDDPDDYKLDPVTMLNAPLDKEIENILDLRAKGVSDYIDPILLSLMVQFATKKEISKIPGPLGNELLKKREEFLQEEVRKIMEGEI